MYRQIKDLADQAIALQNKDRMDAALREISNIAWAESMKTCFEDARIAKWGSEPCPECMKPRARCAPLASDPGFTLAVDDQADGSIKLTGWDKDVQIAIDATDTPPTVGGVIAAYVTPAPTKTKKGGAK